jgi:hypothetical protein
MSEHFIAGVTPMIEHLVDRGVVGHTDGNRPL